MNTFSSTLGEKQLESPTEKPTKGSEERQRGWHANAGPKYPWRRDVPLVGTAGAVQITLKSNRRVVTKEEPLPSPWG